MKYKYDYIIDKNGNPLEVELTEEQVKKADETREQNIETLREFAKTGAKRLKKIGLTIV